MGGAGSTPIHKAAKDGNLADLRIAVQNYGSRINDQEKDLGYSALHVAAWQGYDAIARELLARGADPNLLDKEGRTALHLAAQKGHGEVVRALLRTDGTNREIRDQTGRTAWEYCRSKHPKIAQMIGPPDLSYTVPPMPHSAAFPAAAPAAAPMPPPQPPPAPRPQAPSIYPSLPSSQVPTGASSASSPTTSPQQPPYPQYPQYLQYAPQQLQTQNQSAPEYPTSPGAYPYGQPQGPGGTQPGAGAQGTSGDDDDGTRGCRAPGASSNHHTSSNGQGITPQTPSPAQTIQSPAARIASVMGGVTGRDAQPGGLGGVAGAAGALAGVAACQPTAAGSTDAALQTGGGSVSADGVIVSDGVAAGAGGLGLASPQFGRANSISVPQAVDESHETGVYLRRVLSSLRQPWHALTVGEVLGQGSFGTVHKGVWRGHVVAIKLLNLDRLSTQAQDALRQEALVMCELRHPCIAPVYCLVDDIAHHALVMRYYPRGSVAAAISSPRYCERSLATRLKMALQVASGMWCLHARAPAPVIHGDLKTSNLLVDDDGAGVAIADFGLACCLGPEQAGGVVASGALTLTVSPPEVLEDPDAPRTPAGDVYAFSIVMFEVITGTQAYRGLSADQITYAVCGGRRPTIPGDVPPDVASIITSCWAQDPAARPTFEEVVARLEVVLTANGGISLNAEVLAQQGSYLKPGEGRPRFSEELSAGRTGYAWRNQG